MPADDDQFDPDRLLEVLDAHRVEYVLVGGFAARIHGATRRTADLDCVPHTSRATRHIRTVVVSLAALDDIVSSKEFADRPKDREALPELHRLLQRGSGH